MENFTEKRSARRFAQEVRVEVEIFGRPGWRGQGRLLDCSAEGVGLRLPEDLKGGAVILLRAQEAWPHQAADRQHEAGPFHMVTAKIRWCRQVGGSSDPIVFRIGAKRLLPVH